MSFWRVPVICALVLAIMLAVAWRRHQGEAITYANWLSNTGDQVTRYQAFLRSHKVDDVLPMEQLLISTREPGKCPSLRYDVPPQSIWQAIVPTLQLIQILKMQGLVRPRAATSGYRSTVANECSGGARASIHMRNNAIDLDLIPSPDGVNALCTYWRSEGAKHTFGLGFYNPEAIHIDTAGHRTWGNDFTAGTSLCAQPSERMKR